MLPFIEKDCVHKTRRQTASAFRDGRTETEAFQGAVEEDGGAAAGNRLHPSNFSVR